MKILLNPIGSRGDIQPLVALGARLKQQGHEIRMAGSPNGADMAARHQLDFHNVGFDVQQILEEKRGAIANPVRLFFLFRDLMEQSLKEQFKELVPHVAWADVVISGGVVLAAASLCEREGKPFRYVAYCPQIIPSQDHPVLFVPFVRMPKIANRLLWWFSLKLIRFGLRKHFLPARKKLGLETTRDIEQHVIPKGKILYAIDERLTKIADDLQPAVSTGFFHLPQPQELPADLVAFIEAGEPPLYIGFGSMTDDDPQRTTNNILAAAKAAGVRVVISRGWAGLGDGAEIPSFAYVTGPISHEMLFPRMAGIVHHGGAGTTAAASRSGRPQAIVPHLLDQFYWAERLERLRIGPKGSWKIRLNTKKIQAIFTGFLQGEYEENAMRLGEELRNRDGLQEAVAYIEALKT